MLSTSESQDSGIFVLILCGHPDERNLIACSHSNKRLCQLKIRREAKQRSLDARGSRKDHVHDGHNGSRSVSCVHQLCSCACTETPQLFSNRHVGTQRPSVLRRIPHHTAVCTVTRTPSSSQT